MELIKRKRTKKVKIGNLFIGGDAPIAIQSMLNVPTLDYEQAVIQIKSLAEVGCEIIRVAVLNDKEIPALKKIVETVKVPIVADIHFHYKLALKAIEAGVAKIRLNPGNIYKKPEIKEVISAAKQHKIPIRIGANSGSVRKVNNKLHQGNLAMAGVMVDSVLEYLKIFEENKFDDIVISLKASNVVETVEAYRLMSKRCSFPLHLGITAAGNIATGSIKSAIGIGSLLLSGTGDTIRVSLTGDPKEEVRVAKEILQALSIRSFGPDIISCPTCGRCRVDLIPIVEKLTTELKHFHEPLKIAVMGCVVNGPGEAKEVDFGIASGDGEGVFFKKGKIVKKVKEKDYVKTLVLETKKEVGKNKKKK